MNSESLISALTSIPAEDFDFDEVSFDGHHDIDNESVDSLGSCCNSPNQSSDSSLSPNSLESHRDGSPTSNYFIFPPVTTTTTTTNSHLSTSCESNDSLSSNCSINSTPKIEAGDKGKRKVECKVKRNERERRRVRRLADGFRKLREVVPGNYKKLSKLDTLKRALDYMSGLSDILQMHSSARFGNDSLFENGAQFIKQEPNQYSPEYHPYQVPMYQGSTIAYPPGAEWAMYAGKNEHNQMTYPVAVPTTSAMDPYYAPQRMVHYQHCG